MLWLLLAVPLLWLLLIALFAKSLRAVWREPVLRHPVLIIESDDWGAGPVVAQAEALERLASILGRFRDAVGHPPVMTLAMILAVPDGRAIRQNGCYHRDSLDAPRFDRIRTAIESGRATGVFAPQLHGLEHYWPAALMASPDPAVHSWLLEESPATSEHLPAPLQSRWVDSSSLPSRPLGDAEIEAAVTEETALYRRVFGEQPRVAVPPTFVWNERVEAAWSRAGVEFVITPGLRSACRDAAGLPQCDTGPLLNGQAGASVTYLVRDDYFEPERGHTAPQALAALVQKIVAGRPCLLEIHRSNFLGARSAESLTEMERLLDQALRTIPGLRFLSTLELGRALRDRDTDIMATRLYERLPAWWARLRRMPRFWRLARLSGLAVVLYLPVLALRLGLARK